MEEELKEIIKSKDKDIEIIKNYWINTKLDDKLNELEKISNDEEFWKNKEQANILKEIQNIKKKRDIYREIIRNNLDLLDFINIFKDDKDELINIKNDIKRWVKLIDRFKIDILLNKKEDSSNCFLSINSGAGGTESQDWANMLLRMYIRFCERENLEYDIIDYIPGEVIGIKSVTLFVKGENSYGLLKEEQGIHRLVRISPFDANKKRHTSFAGVIAICEVPQEEIVINPQDLKIETFRAGGAGGQHVNKTESAVRITHIPTSIVVQCQNERSQIQNKETAMKMLYSKLAQKAKEERIAKENAIEKKKIEWGSQIRSYILHPYKMVKDHRTNLEVYSPEDVLDGNIMQFIEKSLIQNSINN